MISSPTECEGWWGGGPGASFDGVKQVHGEFDYRGTKQIPVFLTSCLKVLF